MNGETSVGTTVMVNSNLLELFPLQYRCVYSIHEYTYINIYGYYVHTYLPFVRRGSIINNQIPRVINITVQILLSSRGESIDAKSVRG